MKYSVPENEAEIEILEKMIDEKIKKIINKLQSLFQEKQEDKMNNFLRKWIILSEEKIRITRENNTINILSEELSDNLQIDYYKCNNWSYSNKASSNLYNNEINIEDIISKKKFDRVELQAIWSVSIFTVSTDNSMSSLEETFT